MAVGRRDGINWLEQMAASMEVAEAESHGETPNEKEEA